MHWKDLRTHEDHWRGLELTVGRRPMPPAWRVEFASPRFLRLSREGVPLLWARVGRDWQGFWWLSASEQDTSPLEPLLAQEVDALAAPLGSDSWYAAWARHFAQALAASPHSPLHEGCWQLLRGFPYDDDGSGRRPAAQVSHWAVVKGSGCYPRQSLAGFVHWGTGYTNLLLGLKPPAALTPSRLKVWRKRVREGSLPPVLALFVTGLDCFVVLDGHHRWMAALEENRRPALLTLWPASVEARAPRIRDREVVERLAFQSPTGKPLGVDSLNRLALDAWDGERSVRPNTRAWPLPGSFPGWESEVRARLAAQGPAVEPGARESLLLGREE